LTSKFGKIGLFDDPGGQGSSPKDFICRFEIEQWARIKASKREIQIWLLLDFTLTQCVFENPTFSPVVHRDARPTDGQ
jgi:hypothetical protein